MRRLLLTLLAVPVVAGLPARAAPDCRPAALAALRAAATDGFAIYRQTTRPDVFRSWIDCGASQYDLPTAVHETTHLIAAETDAFPLVGGGAVARPHGVSDFFPPSRIADRFRADDFTAIYLHEGKASSATDVLYLLDELNAYAHDLDAAVDLRASSSPDLVVDHRDGLAAMMAFLAEYAEVARSSEPDTWRGLRQPEVATAITALWSRAENVMKRSCGIPNFGTLDRAYNGRVCAAGASSALAPILGRTPACPLACLEPEPEPSAGDTEPSADAADIAETETVVTEDPPRHPFAGNAGPRCHPVHAADR